MLLSQNDFLQRPQAQKRATKIPGTPREGHEEGKLSKRITLETECYHFYFEPRGCLSKLILPKKTAFTFTVENKFSASLCVFEYFCRNQENGVVGCYRNFQPKFFSEKNSMFFYLPLHIWNFLYILIVFSFWSQVLRKWSFPRPSNRVKFRNCCF